jgi:hypothetical protein
MGVLIQNGHVVCYKSGKLKEHERLYGTHDLELEAIVCWINERGGESVIEKFNHIIQVLYQ